MYSSVGELEKRYKFDYYKHLLVLFQIYVGMQDVGAQTPHKILATTPQKTPNKDETEVWVDLFSGKVV